MRRKTILYAALLVALVALVSTVIPRPHIDYPRSSGVEALADVKGIELSLVTMLADADVINLRDLFDPVAFKQLNASVAKANALDSFAASVQIYSDAFHLLLSHGRKAPELAPKSDDVAAIMRTLRPKPLAKLGTAYLDIRQDPWGSKYNIYLGPWPKELGPIPFRIYHPPTGEADALTVTVGEGDAPEQYGLPAPSDALFYIWSNGPNEISDQATFDPSIKYPPPAEDYYPGKSQYYGGGDDINSWDKDESWSAIMSIPYG